MRRKEEHEAFEEGTPLALFFTMKELRNEGLICLLEMNFGHEGTKTLSLNFKGLLCKEEHEGFEECVRPWRFFITIKELRNKGLGIHQRILLSDLVP